MAKTDRNGADAENPEGSPLSNAALAGDVRGAVIIVAVVVTVRWLARGILRLLSRPI